MDLTHLWFQTFIELVQILVWSKNNLHCNVTKKFGFITANLIHKTLVLRKHTRYVSWGPPKISALEIATYFNWAVPQMKGNGTWSKQ